MERCGLCGDTPVAAVVWKRRTGTNPVREDLCGLCLATKAELASVEVIEVVRDG